MNNVAYPPDGANVHGVVDLRATAQSDFGVTNVYFEIVGPSGRSPERLRARNSIYGWVAVWDSRSLPNGKYRIESVAFYRADHRRQSKPVVVHVKN
jgi:hypothetical protein